MTDTITIEPAGKRLRNAGIVLTDRICAKRVDRRVKIYDRKASGLYISIIPAGVATFFFKFTDRATGKQRSNGSASITRKPSPLSMPEPPSTR